MIRRTLTIVACSTLMAGATAQQTWIVDPSGGGNFTRLAAAVAAASSGDTIVLRGGGSHNGIVFDKALSFVGEAPQSTIWWFETTATLAAPFVTVSGVRLGRTRLFGPAAFENVDFTDLVVIESGELRFHRCGLWAPPSLDGMYVFAGNVVITESLVVGGGPVVGWGSPWGCTLLPGGAGIVMQQGTLTIADSTVVGAGGITNPQCFWPIAGPRPALQLGGGIARVTGSVLRAGAPLSTLVAAPVTGAGQLEFDASTAFVPANTVGTMTFLPGTGGQGSAPGGAMSCRVETGPLLPAALVASLGFGSPVTIPEGIAWVDLSAFVVLVIGFTDGAGVLNAAIQIPPSAPRGLPITVQSVAAPSATGRLTAGTPAVLLVQ